jgi:hypothetical protein
MTQPELVANPMAHNKPKEPPTQAIQIALARLIPQRPDYVSTP